MTRFGHMLLFGCAGPLAALVAAPSALAQPATYDFNIPAQPLPAAIIAFSRQTGITITAPREVVANRRSAAVRGSMAPSAALAALLRETGLRFEVGQGGSFTILPRDRGAPLGRSSRSTTFLDPSGEGQGGAVADGAAGHAQPDPVSQIIVTGTRLVGTSPTSPVITIGRRDFDQAGHTSVQDVLSRVPQNFSSLSPATGTAGSNVGLTTQADLRGLGSQSTLTLVNGRRVAGAAGNSGRAFDISMIPLAAVERVDILTDGASAIYGSDAVGGVVNIVLRRNFEGIEGTVQYGVGDDHRQNVQLSLVGGTSWSSGRAIAAFQYDDRDALSTASIGLTTADYRARGGGDFRVEGFGAPGTVYPAGFFEGAPFDTVTTSAGGPVFFAALPAGDGRNVPLASLRLNELTFFDPVQIEAVPAQETISGYLTIEQEVGGVTLFADAVYSRRTITSLLLPNFDYLFVPETNAFSPFQEDVFVGYVFDDLGPVGANATSEGWFVNAGARGSLFGNWRWEIVGARTQDEFSTGVTSINLVELDRRLASSDPAQAFNPFGDGSAQSASVLDAIRTQSTFAGSSRMNSASAQIQGPLAQLPGGSLRLLVGGEFRSEEVDTRVSRPGRPVNVLFPNASRDSRAIFGEAYFPLIGAGSAIDGVRELAVSAAARYEDYSDFGVTINPKIGILWRPVEDLLLRGTWGTSFRAPGLRELFSARSTIRNFAIFDPNAPSGGRVVRVDFISGGNPALGPEEAETLTLSADYRPGWFPGAHISVGYYATHYTDRIRGIGEGLSPSFIIALEDDLPPGIVVRAANGTLQSLNLVNVNAAVTRTSGFDLAFNYSRDFGSAGTFSLNAAGTIVDRFEEQIIAGAPFLVVAGNVGAPPEWRARVGLAWQRDGLGANLSVNHIPSLFNSSTDPRIVDFVVEPQTTVDLQLSYSTEREGRGFLGGIQLRVGVRNLFDERPPFVDEDGYDARNHTLEGRTFYIRLSKRFGGLS